MSKSLVQSRTQPQSQQVPSTRTLQDFGSNAEQQPGMAVVDRALTPSTFLLAAMEEQRRADALCTVPDWAADERESAAPAREPVAPKQMTAAAKHASTEVSASESSWCDTLESWTDWSPALEETDRSRTGYAFLDVNVPYCEGWPGLSLGFGAHEEQNEDGWGLNGLTGEVHLGQFTNRDGETRYGAETRFDGLSGHTGKDGNGWLPDYGGVGVARGGVNIGSDGLYVGGSGSLFQAGYQDETSKLGGSFGLGMEYELRVPEADEGVYHEVSAGPVTIGGVDQRSMPQPRR